ncbi:MAG TPA: HEAT repeat domain-containing protein [Cyclobacteriaceae bacterium]|nr:HEAT repeat domain-containing protein [Cyclobacteriaceae bacterium]
MEKEKLESLLIDYIDGKLNEANRRMIEQELVNNPETYKLYEQLREVIGAMERSAALEPNPRSRKVFDQLIHDEIRMQKSSRVMIPSTVYRVAAAIAFLVVAGMGGYWVVQNQKQTTEQARRIEEMEKEMRATKQTMMALMNNDQSASQRITGVTVAYKLEKADDEIVNVLVKTMNEDANTNVRLAALEALGKFQAEPAVRKALIESLSTQKDPMVQIALIQLLVQMKEKGVMKDLERMTKDKTIMKAVKDEAYSGILKLS